MVTGELLESKECYAGEWDNTPRLLDAAINAQKNVDKKDQATRDEVDPPVITPKAREEDGKESM